MSYTNDDLVQQQEVDEDTSQEEGMLSFPE
jgi:hypothetical protein